MTEAAQLNVGGGIARPSLVIDEAVARRSLDAIARRGGCASPAARGEVVKTLQELLHAGRREAERRLLADGKGVQCATTLCYLQDALIRQLYGFASRHVGEASSGIPGRLSVVGVGGYGRGKLSPGSDIDLLFLLPRVQTAHCEKLAEFILYALWDMKLKVGHSTRSVADSIRLARSDGTIKTALLEARHVCGDSDLHAELVRRFRKEVVAGNAREFIAAKLTERDVRHAKSGQSRYLVEPDVKDGMGGLRDLHTLYWIARYLYDVASPLELAERGIFNPEETARFIKCEDFLWAVRCHMHFMTGRSVNRLTFEQQSDLAEQLGYSARAGLRHVERFMKHYFLIAKEVGDLSRIFCAVLEAKAVKKAPGMAGFWRGFTGAPRPALPPDGWFFIDAGRVNVVDEDCFARHPIAVLKLFAVADERKIGVHPDALKSVRRSLARVSARLRDDPQSNSSFCACFATAAIPRRPCAA